MNHSYWQNKIVLVTGASAGFGRVLAGAFAERGARVILTARSADATRHFAAELNEAGHAAEAIPADVTDDASVEALFASIRDEHGRLDLLANIAGKSARGAIRDTTPEQFRELLELNFLAAVRCTQQALPLLLASRGHVVQMGSLASKIASRHIGAYPASKFPLAAYAQQLRLELSGAGLHTLLVCPGPIRRDDAATRYAEAAAGLPESAQKPGGGVKLKGIDPQPLARRILRACERREPELVVPGRARLLFALSQLSPRWGDWLLEKMMS